MSKVKCLRCGRRLRGESAVRGIGPVCLKRERAEAGKEKAKPYKGPVWDQLELFDLVEVAR